MLLFTVFDTMERLIHHIDNGPMKGVDVPLLARETAFSFQSIPLCSGTHPVVLYLRWTGCIALISIPIQVLDKI